VPVTPAPTGVDTFNAGGNTAVKHTAGGKGVGTVGKWE